MQGQEAGKVKAASVQQRSKTNGQVRRYRHIPARRLRERILGTSPPYYIPVRGQPQSAPRELLFQIRHHHPVRRHRKTDHLHSRRRFACVNAASVGHRFGGTGHTGRSALLVLFDGVGGYFVSRRFRRFFFIVEPVGARGHDDRIRLFFVEVVIRKDTAAFAFPVAGIV